MSSENERSYGQGAQGEPEPAKPVKATLRAKLRYSFDNSIARSGMFVTWMLILMIVFSILLVLLRAILIFIPGFAPEGSSVVFDFNTFWKSFASIFGRGGEDFWIDRIMNFLTWAITVALAGSVTGFIVGVITRTFDRLRKGKSPIIDNGHTLILGWSNRIYPILKELAIANQNVRKAKVVIFSEHTRDFMEDEIDARATELGKLKVVTRTGDVSNPEDLKRSNIAGAKSIIVLDSDEAGDANVVSTVLAIKSVNPNPKIRIVAEIDDANTGEALTTATNGQVITVRSHEIIARVTAQASRRPGLAAVILDLLDFAGDEIYFATVPALAGKTYADAILAFNEAAVIGIQQNGVTKLNPTMDTVLSADTKIIAVAEDDDKVIYTGVREDIAKTQVVKAVREADRAESLLIIGWSSMGRTVLNELAEFLPAGSNVHIVAQERFVDPAQLADLSFGDIAVSYATVSGDIDDLIAAAKDKRYDEIIVLGYRNAITESEADAQTMLTMLQMNQLFNQEGNGVEPTRLVAEILDSRKIELARVAAVDDLVVSDSLAALVIAQISENPSLAPVFADLFDAEGATMNVRSITDYAPVGKSVSFAELAATARNFGESAIGYRSASRAVGDSVTGVLLNPAKTMEFIPATGDALVVVGNL
ncbi:MAG: CASTOR/POLLUX-related putative ion channel [Rhodoluna sp.]